MEHGGLVVELADLGFQTQITRIVRDGREVRFLPAPMWRMTMRSTRFLGSIRSIDPGSPYAQPAQVQIEGARAEIRWTSWNHRDGDFGYWDVLVTVDLSNDGVDLSMVVSGRFPTNALESVRFPMLLVEPMGPDDVMFLPWLDGGVVVDPIRNLRPQFARGANGGPSGLQDMHYPSFRATGPYMAYYSQAESLLYLEAMEAPANPKSLRADIIDDTVTGTLLQFIYSAPNGATPGNGDLPYAFKSPGPIRADVMGGRWYTAAQRFRSTIMGRGIPTMEENPAFSRLIRDAELGFFRGDGTAGLGPERFLDFVADGITLREITGAQDTVSAWFFWHTNMFDAGWPNSEAKASVPLAAAAATKAGLPVLAYTIPLWWDLNASPWATMDGGRFAMRFPNQGFQTLVIAASGGVLTNMSAARPDYRQLTLQLVEPVAKELGFGGFYLDVFSGAYYPNDYSHDLQPNGGVPSFYRGKQLLMEEYQRRFKAWNGESFEDSDFMFISEFPDDLLVGSVEAVQCPIFVQTDASLPWVTWRPVPARAVACHERQVSIDYLDPSLIASEDADEFYLTALLTTWQFGKTPTVIRTSEERLPGPDQVYSGPGQLYWRGLRDLVTLGKVAHRFQVFGEKLAPLPGSFEESLDQPLPLDIRFQMSAWRHSGDVAVLLSNASDQERAFSLRMNPAAFPLPDTGAILFRSPTAWKFLGIHNGGELVQNVVLPARGTGLLLLQACEADACSSMAQRWTFPEEPEVTTLAQGMTYVSKTPITIEGGAVPLLGARELGIEVVLPVLSIFSTDTAIFYLETSVDGVRWQIALDLNATPSGPRVLTGTVPSLGGRWGRLTLRMDQSGGPNVTRIVVANATIRRLGMQLD